MTEQTSIWQHDVQSMQFAELCNALYERELLLLAHADTSPANISGRLKSLPHYIKATALCMTQIHTPLELDTQNASWFAKQAPHIPLTDQKSDVILNWYQQCDITHGLVVPIALDENIVLDSVERVDKEKQRFRTNAFGWFDLNHYETKLNAVGKRFQLLKPNKRVMMAACAGHAWVNDHKVQPVIPSLRELRLSCDINWKNFKKPLLHL